MRKTFETCQKSLFFWLIICFFPCGTSSAQNQTLIDSLSKVLENSPRDTNRIPILVALWNAVAYNDLEQSKAYAEEILAFSQEINFAKGIAAGHQRLGISYSYQSQEEKSREEYRKALNIYKSPEGWNEPLQGIILFNIGLGYKSSGKYDSTLYYLSQAREIFDRVGTNTQKGAVFDGLSGMYYETGKYQLALEHALMAIEIYEVAKDSLRLPDAFLKVGQVSYEIKNYPEALRYFRMSLSIYQKNQDTQFEIDAIKNIGNVYSELEQRDSSLYYYQKGLQVARSYNAPVLICEMVSLLSGEYMELKAYEKAKPLLEQALVLSEELKNPTYIIPALDNLGRLNEETHKPFATSEAYFLRALKLAETHGYLAYQVNLNSMLAILNKEHGKPSKAISYFFAHQTLKDSLLDLKTSERIAELQTLYETEKKDREIEQQKSQIKILNQEAEIDSLNRKLLIGGILLSLLLMLAIYFAYRQKMKREQAIHEQEKKAYEQELLFNKKELASHTLHLVQKRDLLEELKENLESTRRESGDSKKNLSQMLQLIKSDKHVEQDWQNFKNYFDKVHETFDSKLRNLSEGLSQNEFRLAALMKMDLSTKEIAAILNISPDSVHKGRYRLKKRLGLGGDENLRDFILAM